MVNSSENLYIYYFRIIEMIFPKKRRFCPAILFTVFDAYTAFRFEKINQFLKRIVLRRAVERSAFPVLPDQSNRNQP